ncbi:MAG: hypothetical protein AVDCRST_MAG22-1321, partial [uncultured Rubrobacteraceae bacterium]
CALTPMPSSLTAPSGASEPRPQRPPPSAPSFRTCQHSPARPGSPQTAPEGSPARFSSRRSAAEASLPDRTRLSTPPCPSRPRSARSCAADGGRRGPCCPPSCSAGPATWPRTSSHMGATPARPSGRSRSTASRARSPTANATVTPSPSPSPNTRRSSSPPGRRSSTSPAR